jgi:hypothetical protein
MDFELYLRREGSGRVHQWSCSPIKSVIHSEGLDAGKGEESHPNEMLQLDKKITKR